MPDRHRRTTALEIFSTCPQSKDCRAEDYLQRVIDVARCSEAAGCTGILVYTDNGLVDPWLVAETIIAGTERICPLVAIQPVYMHPYSVAKMVTSLAYIHQRRVYLNMVAGGFRGDLQALNDPTPHDERYQRLIEYTSIIKLLLESAGPVNFSGSYYTIRNLRMTPALPTQFMPGILMSGSSAAGMAAARAVGAMGIVYPQPVDQERGAEDVLVPRGARLGIIARSRSAEAWDIAHERFPADAKGRAVHKLAMAVSDSVWHQQLSQVVDHPDGQEGPYWLWPFQTYKTFCPYLVGSYDEVGNYIAAYIADGYHTFILDVPRSPEDLECARVVFSRAAKAAA